MSELDTTLHHIASQWSLISYWGAPICWMCLGLFALTRQKRFAGACLIVAGGTILLFSHLFADGSWFTDGWATDAPTNVLFSYKPLGYLAANLLPAISNISLILACFALVRQR